jgi:hypothetical protein
MEICVENFFGALLKALVESTPNIARVMNQGLRYRPAFRKKKNKKSTRGSRDRFSGNTI